MSVGINVDLGGLGSDPGKNYQKAYVYRIKYGPRVISQELQAKVDAARKAGLHPLFAMGGSTNSPNPAMIGGYQGSGLRGSVSSKSISPEEAEFMQARLETERAQASMYTAQADYFNSEAARNRQQPPGTDTADPQQAPSPRRIHHPAEAVEGSAVTMGGKTYVIPPGTPQERLEQEIGDLANLTPDNLRRWYEVSKNQLQDRNTVHKFRKAAAKHGLWDLIPKRLWYQYGYRKDVRRRVGSRVRTYKYQGISPYQP
jgi:hypothetical protein